MKIKVSDYLIKRLAGLGITDIFGLPGDYNFNILDSVVNNPNTNWINKLFTSILVIILFLK